MDGFIHISMGETHSRSMTAISASPDQCISDPGDDEVKFSGLICVLYNLLSSIELEINNPLRTNNSIFLMQLMSFAFSLPTVELRTNSNHKTKRTNIITQMTKSSLIDEKHNTNSNKYINYRQHLPLQHRIGEDYKD